jgi:hypothetical protein
MASVYVMTLADGCMRVFESLEALTSAPDVKNVTQLAGGHAVATLRDGSVLPVRRVALESGASAPVLSPPPPVQRCDSVVSLGVPSFTGGNEDAVSPLLSSVFARTSPFGTSPLPDVALMRTPERNKPEPFCPGAPSRVLVRVSPKRVGEMRNLGARFADSLAAEADGSAASGAGANQDRLE